MADISTSRVMTRSGSTHKVPTGAMCDDHTDRPATHRIQGETDSFGCEYIDWCDECHANYLKYIQENPPERSYSPSDDINDDYAFEEGDMFICHYD